MNIMTAEYQRWFFWLGLVLTGWLIFAGRALANTTIVVLPNGGECLTVSQSYTIEFSYSGANVEHIALYYRTDGQQPSHLDSSVIKHPINVPQQGTSWNWRPASADISETGRIWIDGHDNGHVTLNTWDQSNANFAVRSSCAGGGGGGGGGGDSDAAQGRGGAAQEPIPPPAVQKVTIGEITNTTAHISWRTDRYSYTRIIYGQTSGKYNEEVSLDPLQGRLEHELVLRELKPATDYYFQLVTGRLRGEEVKSDKYRFSTLKPPDFTPPAPVSGLFTLAGNSQSLLAWINPPDLDFKAVIVTRRTDRQAATPEDGELVGRGDQTFHLEHDLQNNTSYYYSIFTVDHENNYSSSVTAAIIPRADLSAVPQLPALTAVQRTASEPRPAPEFRASAPSSAPARRSVVLKWRNPEDPDFLGVQIVRNENSLPAHAFDGRVIFRGRAQEFHDENLANDQRYFYGIFPFDWNNNFANGSLIAESPSFMEDLLELRRQLDELAVKIRELALKLTGATQTFVREVKKKIYLVVSKDGRYQPQSVIIKQGEAVRWVSGDQTFNWPASDAHPVHTGYPGFDSLGVIGAGEDFVFTFGERGEWGYHNHLNPNQRGNVIVQ